MPATKRMMSYIEMSNPFLKYAYSVNMIESDSSSSSQPQAFFEQQQHQPNEPLSEVQAPPPSVITCVNLAQTIANPQLATSNVYVRHALSTIAETALTQVQERMRPQEGLGDQLPTKKQERPEEDTGASSSKRLRMEDAPVPMPRCLQTPARSLVPPGMHIPEAASFIVFDTETSGLSNRDLIVQFAYIVCANDGKVLDSYNALWKLPYGMIMSKQSIKVHGIEYKHLRERGLDAASQLKRLEKYHARTQQRQHPLPWVAHNATFDRRMVRQTAQRNSVAMHSFESNPNSFFCTLEASARQLQNHHVNGARKSRLKNVDLYKYLHNNEDPPSDIKLHDALGDCRITACNFSAGIKRWHW